MDSIESQGHQIPSESALAGCGTETRFVLHADQRIVAKQNSHYSMVAGWEELCTDFDGEIGSKNVALSNLFD